MSDKSEYSIIEPSQIPCREISDPAVLSVTPLVSVKMMTYNHEPYIGQAIESVILQQTNFPFELVIGEDCSTDGTREIVFDYQKKYPEIIRVITSDKNVGARKNNVRLAKACRGKYIAYCEGDDYWHNPEKLQIQVDYLEAHPECGLVHSDVVWHNVESCKTIPRHYKERKLSHDHENVLRSIIEFKYHVMTCTAVIRKCLLDEIHQTCRFEFSEKFLMGDIQTWIEIARRSKVKYIDETLATYNALPESACRTKDIDKTFRFRINFAEIRMYYADKYCGNDSKEIKKDIERHLNRGLLYIACSYCRRDLAREVLDRARKHEVSVGIVGYLYFFGSQNNIISSIVKAFILLAWQCRRVLSRVKWLRALRDRIRT
jgi:glycosyltransferase involved in cell wall biosynthesis